MHLAASPSAPHIYAMCACVSVGACVQVCVWCARVRVCVYLCVLVLLHGVRVPIPLDHTEGIGVGALHRGLGSFSILYCEPLRKLH
jgi:hypothetical protein